MTVLAPSKTDDSPAACGTACDCNAPAPKRHLSWPATLAWVAGGTALCLIIMKLFGV